MGLKYGNRCNPLIHNRNLAQKHAKNRPIAILATLLLLFYFLNWKNKKRIVESNIGFYPGKCGNRL
jgi:hypothetical protein